MLLPSVLDLSPTFYDNFSNYYDEADLKDKKFFFLNTGLFSEHPYGPILLNCEARYSPIKLVVVYGGPTCILNCKLVRDC